MKIYITTDTHFNHKDKMVKYCGRVPDYEARLITYFSLLEEGDTLIHLGDICIGDDSGVHERIIHPMRAKKVLIKGNHDIKSRSWYLDHGWDFVCTHLFDKYFGFKVLFSHMPVSWDGIFDINLHGHLHNLGHRPNEKRNCMNHLVSLERDGYRPLLLENVLMDIRKKFEND